MLGQFSCLGLSKDIYNVILALEVEKIPEKSFFELRGIHSAAKIFFNNI